MRILSGDRLRSLGSRAASILFYVILPLGLPTWAYERTGSAMASMLAFLAAMILFALYRVYQARELVMMNLRMVETQMFGKPLDRENWERGELRRVKPFGWKK